MVAITMRGSLTTASPVIGKKICFESRKPFFITLTYSNRSPRDVKKGRESLVCHKYEARLPSKIKSGAVLFESLRIWRFLCHNFIHLFNSGHDDKTISGVYFSFNTFSPFLFKLEASFNSNVATIEANCERVEARINTLLEKFETKGRWLARGR